ncbi:ImmA/IrrE family metallo-endopeptidase [Clostridium sp.]|uniref:ImmA/IrrE family metallo-endopeptidase n=1 Tax=Clostridium sp. TaxID=1506 RepID=UPI003F4B5084
MYEELVNEAQENGVDVIEMSFNGNLKGLYSENTIAINSKLKTNKEKNCVLAEELGHHHTSFGDILNIKDVRNIKQEKIARNWGYEKLVGVLDIINSYKNGAKNRLDMAEHLNVTEEFLEAAIAHYKEKYGLYYEIDHYIIYFDPLGVLQMF